jgi:hypothetical protein
MHTYVGQNGKPNTKMLEVSADEKIPWYAAPDGRIMEAAVSKAR